LWKIAFAKALAHSAFKSLLERVRMNATNALSVRHQHAAVLQGAWRTSQQRKLLRTKAKILEKSHKKSHNNNNISSDSSVANTKEQDDVNNAKKQKKVETLNGKLVFNVRFFSSSFLDVQKLNVGVRIV
jgi:hypothetical protein